VNIRKPSCVENWPAIVGETVAAHTTPVAIQNGALVIETDNVAWSQQLAFLEREIIEAVPGVSRLRFRSGRMKPSKPNGA
jgi:predicted nucleic acid-binding Zn ribbon protein